EYRAKKKADTKDYHEHESAKVGCSWRVNLYLTKGIIYVTSICKKHNYLLHNDIRNLESKFHRLSSEMLEEVEFLININCSTGPIICGLQKPIVSDKMKETYQWILRCLLHATNSLALEVLFTDADLEMIAAIHETLPSTKYNYCIWHIRKNLEKNLKRKLRNEYFDFITVWNKCRNSFSENEFKKQWHDQLTNYPVAKKYLRRALGVDLDKEEKFERLEEQNNQNLTIGLSNIINRYFKRINIILKKYLISQILKIQHRQMNESLLYLLDFDEKINIQEIYREGQEESDDEEEDDNTDLIGVTSDIKFVEDNYEFVISNLDSLTKCINRTSIDKVYKKHLSDSNESRFEYQIETNFNSLNKIRHMQIFLETVKQNLSHQINEKKKDIHNNINESNKENLSDISNPYLTRTKGASKKRIKSALENTTTKCYNKKTTELVYVNKNKTCITTEDLQDTNYEVNKSDYDKQLEEAIRLSRQNNNL
ncbi:7924_t:CDS:2, partial [Scutellospora calospora]